MKKFICSFLLLFVTIAAAFLNPMFVYGVNAASVSPMIDIPIVMYHSVLKSRQEKYVVSPNQLESDFSAYKEMGYTPVFLREVADFVDGKGKLPAKPMVITFDDGHYNNLHYALPIAQKFNFKIVINVVTSFSELTMKNNDGSNPNYSYLTLPQLKELHDSGLVEIGNHTHAMHKFKPRYGIARMGHEDDLSYAGNLRNDIEHAQELIEGAGVPRPVTFAYPFGKYSDIGCETLRELGFRALLTCNEGVSKISVGDTKTMSTLKRYNRSGNTTTEAFVEKIFKKVS